MDFLLQLLIWKAFQKVITYYIQSLQIEITLFRNIFLKNFIHNMP